MSNSSSGDSSAILNSLRQYRFKKDSISNSTLSVDNSNETEYNTITLVPGRKRVHTAMDSSSDEATPPLQLKATVQKSKLPELTIKEKEAQLIALKKLEPDYDTMICQDALLRCNWNAKSAAIYLRENCVKKASRFSWKLYKTVKQGDDPNDHQPSIKASSNNHYELQNGHSSKHHPRKKVKQRDNSSSDCSDDNDRSNPTERVFESDEDDSETDMMYEMTRDRKGVLQFMNTATSNELQMVKTCSLKKVEAILELRPFNDWNNLIRKLQAHKNLSTDLLNFTQELLNRRNNMTRIMNKCDKLVRRLEIAFADASTTVVTQPANLNPNFKLANYQMAGLHWLTVMHREQMNGILADEMGLGKTIQVIAFLAYLKETKQSKKTHLIVVPSSTLDNWMHELTVWCPQLVVEKYYGSADERRALRIQYNKSMAGIDVILTTYHMVHSSPEERKMFRVTKMQYVIFDEAHMLKNMTTQRYAYLFNINAERRLLLTGTPMQNNLLELMSLLCFVTPSIFANKTDDIKSLFQKNNKIKGEEDITTFEQTQIDRAKKLMKPFVLRRLKSDVLESLPKKSEEVIKSPLSERQKKYYTEMVDTYSNEAGIVQATSDVSIMTIMIDLRKLANHPLLLRYYYTDDVVHKVAKILSTHSQYKKNPHPQYIFEELAIQSDFQLLQTMERFKIDAGRQIPKALILDSGKFILLDRLLPKLKEDGHRVLIFSQFTMMLDILERYLAIRQHSFLRIDGQTPVIERQDLINQFNGNADIFIFLLSTRAGGLGINLTAADTAIIHDIDFNPYNDKQAEDRCHRMGQIRPVTIYRLISEGTLEEGMHIIAKEKLNLEKEVTGDGGDISKDHKCMVRLLSMAFGINEEKAEIILSPQKTTVSNIKNILEQNHNDNDDDY